MKAIFILTLLILATACGKGGGGGQGQSSQSQSPVIKNCKAEIKKGDLFEVSVAANRVRSECNLSEDEAFQYIVNN